MNEMADNFIKKSYKILKDVEPGVIFNLTKEQEQNIISLIGLNNYNEEHELRILRNYLVLIISKNYKDDYSNLEENQMLLTVITSLIDNKLYKIGCVV